jgi:putative peptidoglycan lipid II flippase
MIPGIIGAGVWQLNLFIDTSISSYLPTGTITCLNLADRLNQLPLGTLGIALSTALLPALSNTIAQKEYGKAMLELEEGLLLALFLTLFATSALLALDELSVIVAFQRGMFGEEQVRITASAVAGFALGLPAYVLTKVFSSLYFAAGDTKFPVIFGIFSVILNALFLIILVPFLKYFGLAMCTSLSAISNAVMLIYFSSRKMPITFSTTFWYKLVALCSASVITYCSLRQLITIFWSASFQSEIAKVLIYLSLLLGAAFVFFTTAVLILYFTKQPQWKLWKKNAWT